MGSPGCPPPPPPPPPPLPPPPPCPPVPPVRRGGRLRALHWEPVPAWRVRGRRSVWAPPTPPTPPLDLPRLRLLFGESRGAAPGQRPPPAAALLEPKRSLAIGVFLKQVKRPVRQIVRDIQDGVGEPYGAEKLLELCRLLPGAAEVSRLRSFPGSPRQLPDPELFMLLLIEVPSYTRRLELLVLQEEFFPQLSALRAAIQTLTAAAEELLECQELHILLHLILSAGNYLNSGGYAGSAAGFRLASLLKLPDTKANEPGMDLLHFVAMEAARMEKNLLDFPGKLRHVGPASRIDAAEVEGELRRLAGRLAGAQGAEGLGPRLQPFVGAAEAELRGARDALQRMHRAASDALDFFCEDAGPDALPELCAVLHGFATRLLAAAQENRVREQAQRRRQQMERERLKRRSVATCSARDAAPREAATDAPLPLTPQPSRRGLRSPRPSLPQPPVAPAALPEVGGCPQPPSGTPASGQGGLCLPSPKPPPQAAATPPPSPQPLFSLFPRREARVEPGTPPPPPQGSALLAFLRRLVGGAGGRAPPR